MWERKLNDFKIGESFMAFFLIRKAECKNTNNGSRYLDLLFGDSSGEITARMWDCTPEDEKQLIKNTLVKVKGNVVEWQGKKQVKVDKIRPAIEEDGVNINEFIPVAPISSEDMYDELFQYTLKIKDKKTREMVQLIIAESGERLLTHPAAVQNHHAIKSGLLYHTLTMLQAGEKIAEIYTFLNKDLLFSGIILHDIAKINEIDANKLGLATDYTAEGQLLGHIIQGIKRIEKAANKVGLDEESSILLQHMILSHHYEPEFGSPKKPMIPEAEVLHYLDILDARMFDMQKALGEVQPGEFTDRIWVLNNRKLYKSEKQQVNEE
ncbi:MAG: CMP-binding protein [Gracilibacter sp. BRH_c7a]|nr:MAG: CMP-binding protein [Gracilibacter sp. BRH_c7a]